MVFELVKVLTPLQAGIAVVICMALSARHMDLYNKHMEKYGALGGSIIDQRARVSRREGAEEVATQPGLLADGSVADGASSHSSADRLV